MQLLEEFVFIHLEQPLDKFNLLLQMLHKLYALVGCPAACRTAWRIDASHDTRSASAVVESPWASVILLWAAWQISFDLMAHMCATSQANGKCCEDNPDANTFHEILLPGHLLCKFMKEKLEDCLARFSAQVRRELTDKPESVELLSELYMRRVAERTMLDVGQMMEYMLSTGNLVSRSGLDLSQASGFTVLPLTFTRSWPRASLRRRANAERDRERCREGTLIHNLPRSCICRDTCLTAHICSHATYAVSSPY